MNGMRWHWLMAGASLALAGCVIENAPCVTDGSCVDAEVWRDPECVPDDLVDLPDAEGLDSDCDGIDGTADEVVFVDLMGDDEAPGTRVAPVRTIAAGLELALASGRTNVLVGHGIFEERVEVVEGIGIHGGYKNHGRGFWRREGTTVVEASGPVLRAENILLPTRIERMSFEAANGPEGESSIAALLIESDGIELIDVELIAGDGGPGATPEQPMEREPADDGAPGTDSFTIHGAWCNDGRINAGRIPEGGEGGRARGHDCHGGRGGNGDHQLGEQGTNIEFGVVGEPPPCRVGEDEVRGGMRGSRFYDLESVAAGADGDSGDHGVDGGSAMVPTSARLSRDGLIPGSGSWGSNGGHGGGGAGGGGAAPQGVRGGVCLIAGAGGGGGGAGGDGGLGGPGGGGGGWSVALMLWRSSPELIRLRLVPGRGGRGGAGAPGGAGGVGGSGGRGGRGDLGMGELLMIYLDVDGTSHEDTTPITNLSKGGAGGHGGSGGAGGAGSGGAGGSSVGLLSTSGSNPALDDVRTDMSGAAGGPGGLSPASGGEVASGVALEARRQVDPDGEFTPLPTPSP